MALLKKGISYGTMIVSKMVFSCTKCDHVDVVSENNYNPSVDIICSKCQSIMLLSSTNTDVVDDKSASLTVDTKTDISDKT